MPWTQNDKDKWRQSQIIQRSYQKEVVTKIMSLAERFEVLSYGTLSSASSSYPLYLIKSTNYDSSKKTILITGGVHGYETSGVQGALAFTDKEAEKYSEKFNFVIAPCISPWAYETINRWNQDAIDPNRSFINDSPAEECKLFLQAIVKHGVEPYAHFDLHETTDTDNTVFRPALEARDGIKQDLWEIPDGFYLVGDSENPQKDFQKSIIDSVRKVTHIAPQDSEGRIIGVKVEQEGVINYPLKKLQLCTGFSKAKFTTTTEVYPDSPKLTDAICVDAQVAALKGGLDYLIGLD